MRRLTIIIGIALLLLVSSSVVNGQADTPNDLHVTEVLPGGDTDAVGTDTTITAIFNRPVVPLVIAEDASKLPQPLTFTPVISGHGEWLDTSVYVFQPDQRLRPGTLYTVNVGAGLKSDDGAVMSAPYQWSFTTNLPQVTGFSATYDADKLGNYFPPIRLYDFTTHGARALLDPALMISFNQPMEHRAVESRFYLRRIGERVETRAGMFKWNDDSTIVSFKPSERLDYSTAYEAGLNDDPSGVPFTGEKQWTFRTIDRPMFLPTRPLDGEKAVQTNGVTLNFPGPMDEDSFDGKITIEPKPESRDDYYQYTSFYVAFPLKASTTYTVKVAPGLKDIYGTVLNEGLTFSFSTAPIPSNLILNVPNPYSYSYGFYNANSPQTGFYIDHINTGLLMVNLYDVSVDDFVADLLDPKFGYNASPFDSQKRLRYTHVKALADPLNQFYPEFLDLSDNGPLPPGIYSAQVKASTNDHEWLERDHVLMMMNANLTVKASLDHLWIWATDVNTGAPIADAPLDVYATNDVHVGSGRTDANGYLEMETPDATGNLLNEVRMVVLKTDQYLGIGSSNWADGIDPGWFGQQTDYSLDPYRIYAYTDRPVYRPGQPVHFRAIIRNKDDMRYSVANVSSVPVQIFDSRGNKIYSQELPVTPFGTINGEFSLGDDAPLGYYRVSVVIPPGITDPVTGSVDTGFSVAEYRLPEFQTSAVPKADQVVDGDTVQVNVDSSYYSGGAVQNSQVDYDVISYPTFFTYTGKGYYSFYDNTVYDEPPNYGSEEVAKGSGTLDDKGDYQLDLPVDLSERPFTQRYQIEATVINENGQAVSAQTSVLIHTGLIYLGARPEHYVNVSGDEAAVNLIAVDWNSNPIPDQSVDVAVVEQRWHNVQEVDPSGRKAWSWEIEEIPVTTGKLTSGADGTAIFHFTPDHSGIFAVRFSTHDKDGHLIRSGATLWVSGKNYVSWRQHNDNRIDLIADQDNYKVGDTAEIMIASPFEGTTRALITVERAGVLHSEWVTMDTNSYVYHLPIVPNDAPNVFVSVMLVKGVDQYNPVTAFRMGLVQLKVDTEQKQLNVEITSDHEQAKPGDTVHYTIRTTDYQGKSVQAEVGVGLTDLASLVLMDQQNPTLLDYFYRLQGIGVRTTTPLTMNVDQLTQQAIDVLKGGGGGGGSLGVIDVRENFVDTPYWNGALVTDATGTVSFDVTLPDNLTTWRLDARAITKGDDGVMLVGQNTADLISTRPLIVRPVTPRFFVVDDKVSLGAIVNNNTDQSLSVQVSLQATGLTVDNDLAQTVAVPANGQTLVRWQATVSNVDGVEAVFYADAGDYTDAARPVLGQGEKHILPVYRYEAPETVGTAGVLRQGDSLNEGIQLPTDMQVTRGELDIHLEPSLAVTTTEGLNYLDAYPYECIEQTVSQFLPNIITYRALAELGLNASVLKVNLNRVINFDLQRLYKEQQTDGGWGWFVTEPSNPLTTAYALIGLIEAQKQGYPITLDVIERARSFLTTTFVIPQLSTPTWALNRQAFVLYALARAGTPDIARSANLFDIRDRLNLDARAFLAMAFNLVKKDDPRAETLLSDLLNASTQSATGTYWSETYHDYWNWGTDVRTSAITLELLTQMRPDSALIPNVVRWLVTQRKTWHWETTQETAWAVMGLTDWMLLTNELKPNYTYDVSMNGLNLAQGMATARNVTQPIDLSVQVSDLLKEANNNLLINRSDGDGALYYTEHLRVWLPVPQIEPLDKGIILQRRYTRPDGKDAIDTAQVGDIVQVHLTVIAPSDLYYITVEDPIPAGTEAIDPGLNTSQQYGTQPNVNRVDSLRYGWRWWWFSSIEFHDEKVVLSSGFLPAGTYEYVYSVRAAIPGVYNVIPPTGQETYFPEVYGRGAGSEFTVTPSG